MQTKHTPGPWRAELEDRLLRDGIEISCEDKCQIAYVQPDDTKEIENGIIVECCSAEQLANARLIAAAPAMAEALRSFYDAHTRLGTPPGLSDSEALGHRGRVNAAGEALRAAGVLP